MGASVPREPRRCAAAAVNLPKIWCGIGTWCAKPRAKQPNKYTSFCTIQCGWHMCSGGVPHRILLELSNSWTCLVCGSKMQNLKCWKYGGFLAKPCYDIWSSKIEAQASFSHLLRGHDTSWQRFHANYMSGPTKTVMPHPCLLALGVWLASQSLNQNDRKCFFENPVIRWSNSGTTTEDVWQVPPCLTFDAQLDNSWSPSLPTSPN